MPEVEGEKAEEEEETDSHMPVHTPPEMKGLVLCLLTEETKNKVTHMLKSSVQRLNRHECKMHSHTCSQRGEGRGRGRSGVSMHEAHRRR